MSEKNMEKAGVVKADEQHGVRVAAAEVAALVHAEHQDIHIRFKLLVHRHARRFPPLAEILILCVILAINRRAPAQLQSGSPSDGGEETEEQRELEKAENRPKQPFPALRADIVPRLALLFRHRAPSSVPRRASNNSFRASTVSGWTK